MSIQNQARLAWRLALGYHIPMAKLQRYAIIGFPLGYSLSPALHNYFFKEHDLLACYSSLPLVREDLAHFFESGIYEGFNVTVPHKEAVIPFLPAVTPIAQSIGAVNTVKRTETGYLGTNTDADGFLLMLKEDLQLSLTDRSILLVGAGGAARAISYAALSSGVKRVSIYDRDPLKTRQLIDHYHTPELVDIRSLEISTTPWKDFDVIINATPIGMENTLNESPISVDQLEQLSPNALVVDIIYSPAETLLLKMARKRGLTAINGLGMLAGQGVLAQQFWFGTSLPYATAKSILLNGH